MTHSVCCDLDVLWCWALAGRAGRDAGHAGGTLGAQAGRWAAAGARTAGSGVRGAWGVRSRGAAWALGARPGRAGWPRAVHSVHSAHFRSVLTRFFS